MPYKKTVEEGVEPSSANTNDYFLEMETSTEQELSNTPSIEEGSPNK